MIPSELRKGQRANAGVLSWYHRTPLLEQYLSVASLMEMRRGALLLELRDPTQAKALHDWLDRSILPAFGSRLLPVDRAVAERCAALQVPAARSSLDVFIAATAAVYDFTLVTRNVRHFETLGVKLLNPFT